MLKSKLDFQDFNEVALDIFPFIKGNQQTPCPEPYANLNS